MALLTSRGMESLLRKIMETGGLTDDMENSVKRLKDDFDEREGILKRYGKTYEGDDTDEYDWDESNKDDESVYTPLEEEKDWKAEYESLNKRYIDRFFSGVPTEERAMEAGREFADENRADAQRDAKPQSLDELLYRTEGD